MNDKEFAMGFVGVSLLGVWFVYLKLTGAIDWSWWWVTVPFWGWFAVAALVLAIFFAAAISAHRPGR